MSARALNSLVKDIRKCRVCSEAGGKKPLPHEPRPVLQVSTKARICIVGQAPGTRVHASGVPFDDPSGDRLRDWLGMDRDTFYDATKLAIVPMPKAAICRREKNVRRSGGKGCSRHCRIWN